MTRFLGFIIILLIIILIGTQIIYPMFSNVKFFWIFRKNQKKINEIINELDDIEVEKNIALSEKIKNKSLKELDELKKSED